MYPGISQEVALRSVDGSQGAHLEGVGGYRVHGGSAQDLQRLVGDVVVVLKDARQHHNVALLRSLPPQLVKHRLVHRLGREKHHPDGPTILAIESVLHPQTNCQPDTVVPLGEGVNVQMGWMHGCGKFECTLQGSALDIWQMGL